MPESENSGIAVLHGVAATHFAGRRLHFGQLCFHLGRHLNRDHCAFPKCRVLPASRVCVRAMRCGQVWAAFGRLPLFRRMAREAIHCTG